MDREAIQERFGIIGTSPAIRHVVERIRQVARTDISVIIEGESGVGKELVAQALHQISMRRHHPLIIVNCGAIPEGLIESELFGAEKGAYTGATERRTGYFEDADRGTIFLDEIGEMPPGAQVRLLRVLETGQFTRVGSSTPRTADVRIIAATNKDLAREVRAGRFREDLYYRLSTVIIRIPPLRERPEDILPIFEHFLHQFAQKYNSPRKRLDPRAEEFVKRYHWPGNVRELRNAAEQATVLLREDTISPERLQAFLRGVSADSSKTTALAPIGRDEDSADGRARERELIYRFLLELRLEMRDVKNLLHHIVRGSGEPDEEFDSAEFDVPPGSEAGVPRVPLSYDPDRTLPAPVRRAESDDNLRSYIEDAPYEIENGTEERAGLLRLEESEELPTIEEAERTLIAEALRRFEGNRRQTAKALGISERTLYRKLKGMEDLAEDEI